MGHCQLPRERLRQQCDQTPSQLRQVKTLQADGTLEGRGQVPRTDKTVRTRGAQSVDALPGLAAPETLHQVCVCANLGQGKRPSHRCFRQVTNTNKLECVEARRLKHTSGETEQRAPDGISVGAHRWPAWRSEKKTQHSKAGRKVSR